MKNILAALIFICVCFATNADLGTDWPTKSEMSKAFNWPSKYREDPAMCKKINEKAFIKNQESIGYAGEEAFTVESQVDLNLDGKCEIVAYQRMYCGNKQCGLVAFQYAGNNYTNLGEVYLGEYLEPINGWLQIRGYSYTGNSYSLHHILYEKGSYRVIRSDRFEYDEKSHYTKYVKSDHYN